MLAGLLKTPAALALALPLALALAFLGSAFKKFCLCKVGISVVIQSSPSNLASTKPWSPALHSAGSKSPAAWPLLTKVCSIGPKGLCFELAVLGLLKKKKVKEELLGHLVLLQKTQRQFPWISAEANDRCSAKGQHTSLPQKSL
eukprot:s308_g14.t1